MTLPRTQMGPQSSMWVGVRGPNQAPCPPAPSLQRLLVPPAPGPPGTVLALSQHPTPPESLRAIATFSADILHTQRSPQGPHWRRRAWGSGDRAPFPRDSVSRSTKRAGPWRLGVCVAASCWFWFQGTRPPAPLPRTRAVGACRTPALSFGGLPHPSAAWEPSAP